MRKIIAGLLTILTVLSLCGCGSTVAPPQSGRATTSKQTTESVTQASEPTMAESVTQASEPTTEKFIGYWKRDFGGWQAFEFFDDGSCEYSQWLGGSNRNPYYEYRTWEVEGDQIIMTLRKSSTVQEYVYRFKFEDEDTLLLQFNGESEWYLFDRQ